LASTVGLGFAALIAACGAAPGSGDETGGGGEPQSTSAPVPTATPVPTSAEEAARISHAVADLAAGHMTTKIPATMEMNHIETVEIRVGTTAFKDLSKDLAGRGKPLDVPLEVVGPVMTVELHGDGFQITPLLEEKRRSVTDAYYGDWQWDVKPTSGGEKVLKVTVAAQVGTNPPVYHTVKDADITVTVNPLTEVASFATSHFERLWSIAPLGLFGALLSRYRNRHAPIGTSSAEPEAYVHLRGEAAARPAEAPLESHLPSKAERRGEGPD
jgi:hypothetical protein